MRLLIALATLMVAHVQAAEPVITFEQTVAAYERGEHALARERFSIQAGVGYAEAQFNYGVMLARGEGGEQDVEAGKGWIAVAASQGYEPAMSAIRGLVQSDDELRGYLAQFADYHPAELFERHAPPSQNAQPETVEESAREERTPIEVSRRYYARYPERAYREQLFGKVRLGAWLHADGRLSDVHVIESVPQNVFDTESVEAFRRWRFDASDDPMRQKPVFVSQVFYFQIPGAEFPADSPIVRRYEELLAKSANDDLALFQAGNLDRYFDFEKSVDREDYLAAGKRLAAANVAMAARRLAWTCDGASECRDFWLRRAAFAGDARAQFWLSRRLESQAPALAEDLLRESATNGMPSAAVKRLRQLMAAPERIDLDELAIVVEQLPANSRSALNANYKAAMELLERRDQSG